MSYKHVMDESRLDPKVVLGLGLVIFNILLHILGPT